jgi:hypothetical protein
MHCVQFEMRLNQLLDDRRDPEGDLALSQHALECSECADLLLGQEVLRRGVEMRLLNEPTAGRDLAVRVAAEVTRCSRDSAWRRWTWSIATIAAAVLLAVALQHRLGGSRDTVPADRLAMPDASSDEGTNRGLYDRAVAGIQMLRADSPQWAEQMADGLKPVAESMSAALHGLRRTFSGGEPAVRSSQFELQTLSRVGAIG